MGIWSTPYSRDNTVPKNYNTKEAIVTMKISIQGNIGSFSHIAATSIFGSAIDLIERDTFKEVFEDLNSDRCEYIVIPIENSTYGSIFQNYDLLGSNDFEIFKEIYLKIKFHLIGLPESSFNDIKELHSHPVGLGQISLFLEENRQIKAIEFPDTAGAVKMIKEKNDITKAAVASKFASNIYGMKILKEDIHENKNNYTRFFALRKKTFKESTAFNSVNNTSYTKPKTTIQFRLGEEAGSLYKCIGAFATRDLALVKIESRPIINTHWEFTFYMDIRADISDEKMIDALEEMKLYSKDLRVLGCYEKGTYIDT
jgi:prephenate dehydratase